MPFFQKTQQKLKSFQSTQLKEASDSRSHFHFMKYLTDERSGKREKVEKEEEEKLMYFQVSLPYPDPDPDPDPGPD